MSAARHGPAGAGAGLPGGGERIAPGTIRRFLGDAAQALALDGDALVRVAAAVPERPDGANENARPGLALGCRSGRQLQPSLTDGRLRTIRPVHRSELGGVFRN